MHVLHQVDDLLGRGVGEDVGVEELVPHLLVLIGELGFGDVVHAVRVFEVAAVLVGVHADVLALGV